MKEWKEYKIGDVFAYLKSGKGIHANEISSKGEYPVFGGNGLRGYTTRNNFEGDCAIIGRQGAFCGNVRYFKGKAYMTEHAIIAVANENNSTRFLAYLLGIMNLGRFSGQSAQPGLSVTELAKQSITVPSLSVQKKIATILSSLDDKIELNRRINGNLEQQAQALFKAWFVDFEPFKNGKFVDSELGRIPEGWKVGHFTDIVKVSGGGTPRTNNTSFWNGSIPFFTPKDASDIVFTYKTEKHITNLGVSNCNSPIYPAHTVFITARGTIGKIKMAGKPMAMNQSCYALLTKKEKLEPYIYLLSLRLVNIMQKKANGAVFEAITTKDFEENIVIPPNEILTSFIQLVNPLFFQIHHNGLENQNLIILKEALLPRLMSGELSINTITE